MTTQTLLPTIAGCPAWCSQGAPGRIHDEFGHDSDGVTRRTHEHRFNDGDGTSVLVYIGAADEIRWADDLSGTVTKTPVHIGIAAESDQTVTPAQARALAAALVEAANLVEAAQDDAAWRDVMVYADAHEVEGADQ
ncbi:hypothetical protein H5397_12755 [Propioniciclava sp. MC1683]|uniref:DUF6907 domain-containing protein n=1 Tax=Propioniciclava sp. MC1683 TaxID=2760309 RepID=UPI00160125C5|nr:hypothetical protein [Propioniciclava sp. MC1683]MBB1502283.1 hypothetical protein [Propioniciclava sp. MC1683]